jgi:hypothetical protein
MAWQVQIFACNGTYEDLQMEAYEAHVTWSERQEDKKYE